MHILTVGNSYTGKSNLNKRFALDAMNRGQNVIVFDPLKASGWPDGSVKFSSPEKFLLHIATAESSHVFVDEAKVLWDYDYKRADRLLYNRRHQGLLVYLIAQRTRMVPPNARNQCSKVFAFRQQLEDANTLAQEYHKSLIDICDFEDGHFIYVAGLKSTRQVLDYSAVTSPTVPPVIKPYQENLTA